MRRYFLCEFGQLDPVILKSLKLAAAVKFKKKRKVAVKFKKKTKSGRLLVTFVQARCCTAMVTAKPAPHTPRHPHPHTYSLLNDKLSRPTKIPKI